MKTLLLLQEECQQKMEVRTCQQTSFSIRLPRTFLVYISNRLLHEFLIAALTHNHKLSGFRQHRFSIVLVDRLQNES